MKKYLSILLVIIMAFTMTLPQTAFAVSKPKSTKLKSVTALSSTSIKIKWKKVTDASGYIIYQKKSNGNYKKIKTITSRETTTFTKKNLSNRTKYTYKVRSYKKSGSNKIYGNYSNEKFVYTKCSHKYITVSAYSSVKKCKYCGKVNPKTVSVELKDLFLIDSYEYTYKNGTFTDSFGNTYNGVHYYTSLFEDLNGREPHSTFNLDSKYKTFSGSIVASTITEPEWTYYINIYVDDILLFSKTGFSKTSGKVDFKVNVKNGKVLKITAGLEGGMGDWHQEIGIVNAQLTK